MQVTPGGMAGLKKERESASPHGSDRKGSGLGFALHPGAVHPTQEDGMCRYRSKSSKGTPRTQLDGAQELDGPSIEEVLSVGQAWR